MQQSNDMQDALHGLQNARRIAIETLKQEYSDLYVLSVLAFDTGEMGSAGHHLQLGEFLTERCTALRSSPLEALTSGRRIEVFRELAERCGYEPDSVEILNIEEPPLREESPAAPNPTHVAYCEYYATGEGVTVFVAVGGTESSAKNAFLRHVPDYFHRGLETDVLTDESFPSTRRMIHWIPQPAIELVAKNPPGTMYYYATLHFNLA